ncbi:MAG: DUF3592 domain-containing protein [Acidobacteria bacterium]|nr:DUF3592 domain-containing protein [Acidobacteriota bacterium]
MLQGRTLAAVLVGVIGVIWTVVSLREMYTAYSSRDWPKAERTVTSVSAEAAVREKAWQRSESPITKQMEFQISYRYYVNDITYTGKRLYVGHQWMPISEFWTRELSAHYPVGGKVQVYYDPNHPAESLLESGFDGYFVAALVGGYVLLLFGVLIVREKFKAPTR